MPDDSLNQQINQISSAFARQFNRPGADYENTYFVLEVYDAYLITCEADRCYRVTFEYNGDELVFAARADWPLVESKQTWVDAMKAQMVAFKAGRRHSDADMKRLAAIHDGASAIQSAAIDLGHQLPEAGVQVIKAGDIPDPIVSMAAVGLIKAAGEWDIDILANPYGGPHNGKDTDGEHFSPRTKFHEDKIPFPPIVYYHGYGDDKRPEEVPDFLGTPFKRWVDKLGVWYRATLDKTKARSAKMMDAARRGTLRASSGVVLATHRVDKKTGEILSWLNGEISIFETDTGKRPANGYAVAIPALKAVYAKAGLSLPVIPDSNATPQTDTTGAKRPVAVARRSAVAHPTTVKANGVTSMTPEELQAEAEAELAAEQAEKAEADAKEKAAFKAAYKMGAEKAAAEKATEIAALKAAAIKGGRLPMGGTPDEPAQAPAQGHFTGLSKFDGMGVDDAVFTAGVLHAAHLSNAQTAGPSKKLLQYAAIKMAEDKTVVKRADGTVIDLGSQARESLVKAGLNPADVLNAHKANELDYSTQANAGDEWVGIEYSRRLWEAIRAGTFVLDKLPSVEVPEGTESIVVPLESADPTWYLVGQSTAEDSTNKRPVASVPSSKLGTAKATLTVGKMGARVQYTQELIEDSLIPWAAQLRKQMEVSGTEALEGVLIDGDTDATASTNINAIDTTPAATTLFLLMNGFRKSPLVTTTANSRSAAGSLVDTDYLATLKLMGTGGMNAQDKEKVEFIVDVNTYWKSLEMASVKTKDVFTAATLEAGELTGIWGYKVRRSNRMHYTSAKRMTNNAGKIDADTDSNNLYGSILAVRYDQWLFGYKRRMTIKVQELIDSDSSQIVATMRVGMVQRDTEASAITYFVGV